MRQNALIITIAVLGAGAVLLGAWGAHGLHGVLDARSLDIWHTAVRFQFWHVLALGLAAVVPARGRTRTIALWAFGVGIVLFCGTLYALALGAPAAVGFITPVGGVALVVGWLALAVTLGRMHSPKD